MIMKRQLDILLTNSRQTKQERLDTIETKQREPLLVKCLDCPKNLYYGRICQGECIKEDEQ
jgi:hypothetical protein